MTNEQFGRFKTFCSERKNKLYDAVKDLTMQYYDSKLVKKGLVDRFQVLYRDADTRVASFRNTLHALNETPNDSRFDELRKKVEHEIVLYSIDLQDYLQHHPDVNPATFHRHEHRHVAYAPKDRISYTLGEAGDANVMKVEPATFATQ